MGTLFVVATPIGNLEDVSLRALRLLGSVGLIAAEDTRTARILLSHHGIKGRLISYNDHNKTRRIPEILDALAAGDVALVTDAGTPAISDPGVELAAAAREAGYAVVAVPGPSAVVAALSVAGLPATRFSFVGFLPRGRGDLRRLIETYLARPEALVAFESPRRLRASLGVIAEVMPERRLAVCRELTKLHEEVFVGTAAEALDHFSQPRGEIVLVIEGAGEAEAAKGEDGAEEETLRREVSEMRRLGLTRSQATALLASRYGVSRRRGYELWLASEESSA
ncbi:MAG: 16S rRNA (cytidine(1402)-2'-O)-methyltransferase [Dehalococcoidia bacterium]|nr:16S rRNA (cytidine(1402)-2'-O)-methyltransferase [Dehalococcoidia bacterium]